MTVPPVTVLAAWNRNALPAFTLTIAIGVCLFWVQGDAAGLDNALGLALVVQMFAASTGFRTPAVLGEFDLVLTRARSRASVVLAHWIVSIVPVMAAWAALAILDLAVVRRGWPMPLTLGPLASLVWVSTAAWAIGAWFGRHSAGALWLLAIFVLGASGRIHDLRDLYTSPPGTIATELGRVSAALVFPFFTFADATVVTPMLFARLVVAAGTVLAVSVAALASADVPLRSRA